MDLEVLSVSKKELSENLSSLQNNFEKYTELVRETNVFVESEKESEKNNKMTQEMDTLKKDLLKMREKTKSLEEENTFLHQKELNFKSQISTLSQQVDELERLLLNVNSAEKNTKIERLNSENLELNMDLYGRLFTEGESRKESCLHDKGLSRFHDEQNDVDFEHTPRKRSSFRDQFISEKIEFPSVGLNVEKPKIKNYMFEESVSVMYPQISFILKKKESFENPKSKIYADYVYVCFDKYKLSRLLVVENKKLFLFKNRTNRKPELEILMNNITGIHVSKQYSQIFELIYKNEKKNEEKLIFENYSSASLFDFINDNQDFDVSRKKLVDIAICLNDSFKNAICNVYKTVKKANFLEQLDVTTSWGNWNLVFVIRVENVIAVFPVQEKYVYEKYEVYRKSAHLIRMDNYNVFNNGRNTGYKKENLFYVKIRNENRDLIFSTASAEEKRTWIQNLSE